jgi:hypothetical protein
VMNRRKLAILVVLVTALAVALAAAKLHSSSAPAPYYGAALAHWENTHPAFTCDQAGHPRNFATFSCATANGSTTTTIYLVNGCPTLYCVKP